ncbi:sensor histidine kinase [Nocardioides sp. HB32]|jgi:signal transduction histidine kinase
MTVQLATIGRRDVEASAAPVDEVAVRKRIERDLHDGAQQRLVSLGLEVHGAVEVTPPELTELRSRLGRISADLVEILEELRRLTRGLHPAVLSEGGLEPALKALARWSPLPVEVDAHLEQRAPEPVEVGAYYLVSEALTNAAKHSGASLVRVEAEVRDRAVVVAVRDDGVGGADPTRGSGLIGLRDRVEILGGSIAVSSRPGEGTTIRATLPFAA